jgi:hypothetical protein
MTKLKHLLLCIALLGVVGWGPFTFFPFTLLNSPMPPMESSAWLEEQIKLINSQADNINPNVLKLSLLAYVSARHKGLDDKQLLTIIDYSKPSTERRLWVVDLRYGKVLFNTWVSHGKNSGNVMATSFSNQPGSLKSSIGLFLTQNPYNGGNGYSLRLLGLEQGINDKAYARDIVVHGAWYADPMVIKKYGQIGRSWGCPAVSPAMVQPLIDTIKDNTLVFAYYPDQNWLKHSSFLAG